MPASSRIAIQHVRGRFEVSEKFLLFMAAPPAKLKWSDPASANLPTRICSVARSLYDSRLINDYHDVLVVSDSSLRLDGRAGPHTNLIDLLRGFECYGVVSKVENVVRSKAKRRGPCLLFRIAPDVIPCVIDHPVFASV